MRVEQKWEDWEKPLPMHPQTCRFVTQLIYPGLAACSPAST
jgi:hypothetical protein